MKYKRALSIVLVLIFLIPNFLFQLWYLQEKNMLKREMKRKIIANIDLNEFKKLTFNVKDAHSLLIWHHNKEFEYKNVMYDIVRKEVQGQFITFWCWKDVKETKLNKMLVTLVNTKLNTEPN